MEVMYEISRAALEREMIALRATAEPKFRAVMARLTPRTTMIAFTGMSQPGRTWKGCKLLIFGEVGDVNGEGGGGGERVGL
jgi:hypothetical protein